MSYAGGLVGTNITSGGIMTSYALGNVTMIGGNGGNGGV